MNNFKTVCPICLERLKFRAIIPHTPVINVGTRIDPRRMTKSVVWMDCLKL